MAKIQTETLVIKISRIMKDSEDTAESVISEELINSIEAVAEELLPNGVIVELGVE